MRIALIALLLTACGARDLSPYVQEDTAQTLALRAQAASAWASVGVETPSNYAIGLLPRDELQDACEVPAGAPEVSGCSFYEERVILLDAARAATGQDLTHELGHMTRGHSGHLQCDQHGRGPDLMCPSPMSSALSARDIAFVLSPE